MSQPMNSAPARQCHHILIIDDSARMRHALADLIVSACLASGKSYRVFHCDKDGRFIPTNESQNPALLSAPVGSQTNQASRLEEFAVYTAPSPKHALFVINSPLFTRLTIISDVMMPSDTEVGLVGMLEALARRNLPVNLVFASSDIQNRYLIARLVDSGKAFFMVKADGVWENLSHSLVNNTSNFQYKQITAADYAGLQGVPTYATRNGGSLVYGSPVMETPPIATPLASAPQFAPPRPVNLAPPAPPPPREVKPRPPVAPKKAGFHPFAALLRALGFR